MTRSTCFLAAVAAVCLIAGDLAAQTIVAYQPVTTYYAPVAPTTYTVASPVVSTPVVTSYVAARPVVVSSPVTQVSYYAPVAPAPVVTTCCSPVVSTPVVAAPTVTYYRAPQVAYQPTAQVVTRYRPLLGGSVSRVRNVWTPVVY